MLSPIAASPELFDDKAWRADRGLADARGSTATRDGEMEKIHEGLNAALDDSKWG